SLDLLCIADTDGRFLRLNPEWERTLGYSLSELEGKGFLEFVHQDDVESTMAAVSDLRNQKEVLCFENRYRCKDGSYRWIEWRSFPKGKFIYAAARDITERRRTEESLRNARREWEDIFRAIGHPVIIMDLEHRIVAANRKCIEVTGKSLDELLNSKCFELFHKSGNPPHNCPMNALLLSNSVEPVEMEMETLGGYYLVSCTPVLDEKGNIRKVIHIAADISERREMEATLRKSENRFRTIYDDTPAMMHSIDKDRVIRNVNKKWLETLGYDRDQVLGRHLNEFMTPPSKAALDKVLPEFWRTGKVIDVPYDYMKKDGKVINALISSVACEDPAWGTVSLTVSRDVTEQLLLQKQLLQAQKMEAIGTLAGGIAHDFNNLLQVIIGYSDLALFDKAPETPDHEALTEILRAAHGGRELVKGLLTFSRKMESRRQPLDLNQEIAKVQKLLSRTIPRMIDIKSVLAPDLMTVDADPAQMEQIIINLAVNAQHAMPDGGRIVIETGNVRLGGDYCRTHVELKPGRYAFLAVSDTGSGIERQHLEHVFEPFYTTKRAGEGTGLGLAVVYGMVKSHGGHIECYSEVGTGTVFKIYLPAWDAEASEDVADTREMPAMGSETILLVDDEPRIRIIVEKILSLHGYGVMTASNGQEALDAYRRMRKAPALVILDLIMPVMGGKECLNELLKIDPHVNVLIASGYSMNGSGREALEAGAKGFVNKPFDPKHLLGEVRRVLDGKPD
ncbi:MAG: PAS domain S-box protein, partial [Pseudomonadota bacterium]